MGSLRSLHTEGHAETVQEDIVNAFDMWAHDYLRPVPTKEADRVMQDLFKWCGHIHQKSGRGAKHFVHAVANDYSIPKHVVMLLVRNDLIEMIQSPYPDGRLTLGLSEKAERLAFARIDWQTRGYDIDYNDE